MQLEVPREIPEARNADRAADAFQVVAARERLFPVEMGAVIVGVGLFFDEDL